MFPVYKELMKFLQNKPCSFATCLFYMSRYLTILVTLCGVVVSLSHPMPDSAFVSMSNPPYSYSTDANITRFPVDVSNGGSSSSPNNRLSLIPRPGFAWFLIEGFLGMTCCWSVQIILQLRLFALYERSLHIKIILILSFCIQLGAIIAIFINGARSGQVKWTAVGPLSKCQVLNVASNFWAFWVTLLAYECLLCCLALNKGYERLRASNQQFVTWAGFQVGLQDVLIRDSVGYYMGCCVIYAINLSLWVDSLPNTFDLATGLGVAYPSLIGNRLMINLRRVFYDSQVTNTTSPSEISLPSLDQVLGSDIKGPDKQFPYFDPPSCLYASTKPPIQPHC
ncbi:hypothetical protein E1B28_002763 [Marasmius oreades]|uniref:Uncharacterized protein n=1 Tax=Marasmius oreades TaxID=181124 RepID=A0A9P7RP19_9AGAR|nr:uncharacterized protein E1B28_002763 [Marasmius oreades]KAG7086842.1 hypothetical protein E1B28_002763 [Marasmius oreades]